MYSNFVSIGSEAGIDNSVGESLAANTDTIEHTVTPDTGLAGA